MLGSISALAQIIFTLQLLTVFLLGLAGHALLFNARGAFIGGALGIGFGVRLVIGLLPLLAHLGTALLAQVFRAGVDARQHTGKRQRHAERLGPDQP
jgi:hypothetical protein